MGLVMLVMSLASFDALAKQVLRRTLPKHVSIAGSGDCEVVVHASAEVPTP